MIMINNYEDIYKILNSYIIDGNISNLEYLYRLAGYHLYIDIGKLEDELFLEIRPSCSYKDRFRLRWILSVNDYLEIIKEFGFSIDNMDGKYLIRKNWFNENNELKMIRKLFNIPGGEYIQNKYGLL